jgi:hypothetical protein
MIPFVRTLRATGCQATIVIFIDNISESNFSSNHLQQLKGCGVIFHNVGDIPNITDQPMLGWVLLPMIDYIYQMQQFYNRILYSDGFDCVFQRDPFQENLPLDKLQIASERKFFKFDGTNKAWYDSLPYSDKKYDPDFIYLNSGHLYGESSLVAKFYDVFLTHFPYRNFSQVTSNDQPYFNYIYLAGHLKMNGIEVEIDRKNGIFSVVQFDVIFFGEEKFGSITDNSHTIYAAVVHKYDLYEPLVNEISLICPQNDYSVMTLLDIGVFCLMDTQLFCLEVGK